MGSSFSLFGMARLGSSFSVLDYMSYGSSMSVRGFVRLGSGLSLSGGFRVTERYQFLKADSYIKEDSSAGLQVYVSGTKAMSIESDGGMLHGSWNVETAVVTSDRRLKQDIVPLQRTLRGAMGLTKAADAGMKGPTSPQAGPKRPGAPPTPSTAPASAPGGDGALWLLRQLRPVSYSFRKGAESKYMRFGFIADELESVVPQVVRRLGDRSDVADQKAVVYQDLIALLAAALQEQQGRMEALERSVEMLRAEIRQSNQEEATAQTKKTWL
jgi:hypothetical protein